MARLTRQQAEDIAKAYLRDMNPSFWNGKGKPPKSVNTATWEDETQFDFGNGYIGHIEIVTITDRKAMWNNKPNIYVDMVIGSESVAMEQSTMIHSSDAIMVLIMSVYNQTQKRFNKGNQQ